MKTLNEYLALPYRMEIVEDREEGGYVVSYPDLPGCLTCGETIESAVENARAIAQSLGLSRYQVMAFLESKSLASYSEGSYM